MGSEAPQSPEGPDADLAIVLAAIDTSSLATRVVELAARMARRTWSSAQLHILHVVHSARFERPKQVGYHTEEILSDAHEYLEHYVRLARRQTGACPVTGHLAQGDPVDQILLRARSLSADMVLVGTNDTTGLERFLLGSVSEKVSSLAPCPVLVVRAKQRAYTKVV
jgi:nucleotide-binding universal stress UspA family protein